MSAVAPASAAAATHKKRQKREAKIRENYDRISAVLLSSDPTRFAARNPTRVIPAVPGFDTLSKAEIKKDCKEIEKGAVFMSNRETSLSKEEDFSLSIERSTQPPIPPHSSLLQKVNRLQQGLKDTQHLSRCLDELRREQQSWREKREALERERTDWEGEFDRERGRVLAGLERGEEERRELGEQYEELRALFLSTLHAVLGEREEEKEGPRAGNRREGRGKGRGEGEGKGVERRGGAAVGAGAGAGEKREMTFREIGEALEGLGEEMEEKGEDFSLLLQSLGLAYTLPRRERGVETGAGSGGEEEEEERSKGRVVASLQRLEEQSRGEEVLGEGGVEEVPKLGRREDREAEQQAEERGERGEKYWEEYVSRLYEGGEKEGEGGRRRRLSPLSSLPPLLTLTNCRSLSPKNLLLYYSPLSLYEDRYLAHSNNLSLLSSAPLSSSQREETLLSLSPSLLQKEEEYLSLCLSTSSLFALQTRNHNTSLEIGELLKSYQDTLFSAQKTENLFRQMLVEEERERERIRLDLLAYSLGGEGAAGAGAGPPPLPLAASVPPLPVKKGGVKKGGAKGGAAAAGGAGAGAGSSAPTTSTTSSVEEGAAAAGVGERHGVGAEAGAGSGAGEKGEKNGGSKRKGSGEGGPSHKKKK